MVQSILLWSLGGWEIFLIVFVILLLFGAKKLPDLARGLGKGIREFKDAAKGESSDTNGKNDEVKK